MTSPVRPYLGESAAERVATRRRKLLDAGFERMATDGFGNVTIESLCKAAKVGKRYFYESFTDLDALVGAVVDELTNELSTRALTAAAESAVRGDDTPALARHVLATVVGYLLDDPRRARVLFRELDRSSAAEAHRRAAIRQLANVLTVYAHRHHGAEGRHPVAELASAMLVGGTIEILLEVLDGQLVRTREELVDDLAGLFIALGDGAVTLAKARALRR